MNEETSDADIVVSILAGNTDGYEVLVRRYQRRLVAVIHRQIGDYDESLDLAQEVFIKVYGALDRYDSAYRFSTWLFRIATNAAIDHLRRRRLPTVSIEPKDASEEGDRLDPASSDLLPDESLGMRQLGRRLEDEIDALPEDYRELIALRHFGELAYEEIATMKKMPIGTVKNKIFRARVLLRERLRDVIG